MLIKAKEKDRSMLLDYCKSESIFNIFIIGDIENFGFSSPYQDVYYQMDKDQIRGIGLRYHNNLIVYSKLLDMDFSLINNILARHEIDLISGKACVIDKLYPHLRGKTSRNDLVFCKHFYMDMLSPDIDNVIVANENHAMDIAISYGDIEEFKNLYSNDIKERYKQIHTRIKSGEGKHFLMLDDLGIVSHGNIAAENTLSGMLGGIFTRFDLRNKGYGSALTSALIRDLKSRDKQVALFYKGRVQERFFKGLGFKEIGTWSSLRREKVE